MIPSLVDTSLDFGLFRVVRPYKIYRHLGYERVICHLVKWQIPPFRYKGTIFVRVQWRIQSGWSGVSRRGTCLALRFQTGSWMLFIDSRYSNKMAAFYTVHTSSSRIFNCLYFPDVTFKTYLRWQPYTFSASQIDCIPLDTN